jgi:hypothetical protein
VVATSWNKNGNLVKVTPAMREWYRDAVIVHPEAPLAQWTQTGAFDTASACEAERLKLIKSKPGADSALCIASDEPRLKEK